MTALFSPTWSTFCNYKISCGIFCRKFSTNSNKLTTHSATTIASSPNSRLSRVVRNFHIEKECFSHLRNMWKLFLHSRAKWTRKNHRNSSFFTCEAKFFSDISPKKMRRSIKEQSLWCKYLLFNLFIHIIHFVKGKSVERGCNSKRQYCHVPQYLYIPSWSRVGCFVSRRVEEKIFRRRKKRRTMFAFKVEEKCEMQSATRWVKEKINKYLLVNLFSNSAVVRNACERWKICSRRAIPIALLRVQVSLKNRQFPLRYKQSSRSKPLSCEKWLQYFSARR